MGLAQSEPLEEQPDFLQLHCTGKPAACGVYSRHGTGTSTVVVSKAKGDLLGVTYNEEGYIRLVEEGSVADKHGLKEHIGKKVLNRDCLDACVDGEKVELCLQDNPWLHNGQHVWSHGTYHLYSTREGKWMLTDSKEGVDKNCGYAMTSAHGGMALTEVPYWMTYVRAKANWEIDASIAVWPYASPLFAVGQLIEYKEKIEDQEFSQGIIGAVRATEGAEQAGAEFKQYGMYLNPFFLKKKAIICSSGAHPVNTNTKFSIQLILCGLCPHKFCHALQEVN